MTERKEPTAVHNPFDAWKEVEVARLGKAPKEMVLQYLDMWIEEKETIDEIGILKQLKNIVKAINDDYEKLKRDGYLFFDYTKKDRRQDESN